MHNEGKIKIIEAAQRLIALNGVEKTSMRNIAEEAGLTTGAIYHYYKSKEALLYDVMDYSSAITADIMQMRTTKNTTPDEVLDEIARKVTQRLLNSSAWRLRFYLAYQAALGDEALREKFSSDYKEQAERTAKLFNYVFDTESDNEDHLLATLMVAALDGINLQQFIGALPEDVHALAKIYNEFFAYAIPNFQKNRKKINRFGS